MALGSGTILGPYAVTAKIGEGGMGEVWQARDTKLDRDVALKVLPEAFTSDPDRLARFEREAKVLASLNHPNIGSIYGFEEAEGVKALVLELVKGPTLADRIKQGPIPIDEALPVWDVLPKRLARFGLTMHPVKSRVVPFRRPRRGWRPGQDGDRFPPPGTFDVLGFTHYWGLARTGSWVLKRKTAKDRLRRTLTAINRWCGVHRHASVAEQHRMLAYYGITANASSLSTCSFHVVHIWQKWLNRRSQKRSMPWKRFLRLLVRYPLPRMTAIHSAARA